MPGREMNPFTALTRIRSQFLRTQWRTIIKEWTRLRLRPLSHRGCQVMWSSISFPPHDISTVVGIPDGYPQSLRTHSSCGLESLFLHYTGYKVLYFILYNTICWITSSNTCRDWSTGKGLDFPTLPLLGTADLVWFYLMFYDHFSAR